MRNCGQCRFYKDADGRGGQCRRNPPIHSGRSDGDGYMAPMWLWPRVCTSDWCGEFKEKGGVSVYDPH